MKGMWKRNGICALLLALGLSAAACGGGAAAADICPPRDMAEAILGTQEQVEGMRLLTPEDDGFAVHLSAYYGIDAESLEDGAIYCEDGAGAREIAVLVLGGDAETGAVEALLLDYIDSRIGEFFGYMPEQVRLLEQALVVSGGDRVALLICEQPQRAEAAFLECLAQGGEASGAAVTASGAGHAAAGRTADQQEDAYDAQAVLAAWRTGDRAGLTPKNWAILAACAGVIDELVTDDMPPHRQELVIHDWIIGWAEYDVESKNRSPTASPHPDNDNPYGLLVGRRAICTGYTLTFQLFMDMLDIECLTVYGTARETNEHAWNMVRLDGEWYCVDLTWNDPVDLAEPDEAVQHKYFNVTGEAMRESNHQWDERATPAAEGTRHRWLPPTGAQPS